MDQLQVAEIYHHAGGLPEREDRVAPVDRIEEQQHASAQAQERTSDALAALERSVSARLGSE